MNDSTRAIIQFTRTATQCGIEQRHIVRLLDLAKTAQSLNLAACNVGLSKAQQTRADNVDNEAREIVHSYGLAFIAQGDPRGAPFIINETENGNRANKDLPNFRVPAL